MIFRGGSEFNDPALDPRRSHNFPLNGFTITPLLFFAAQARTQLCIIFPTKPKKGLGQGRISGCGFLHTQSIPGY